MKGEERQRQLIDPQNRFGGPPNPRRPEVYRDRSPLYGVDKLQIPLSCTSRRNDDDVNIEESMPLVDALKTRKPQLAETTVYADPPGGHLFDRRVDCRKRGSPRTRRNSVDSWTRVWRFLARTLTVDESRRYNERSSDVGQ